MRNLLRGRRRAWLAVPVVLVAAAGVGAWLLTQDPSAAESPTTITVAPATMKETVPASGTLQPKRSAELDFEVAGTVSKVYVEEGDRVRKGQALAAVDDEALVANRTAAAAGLAAANAQLVVDENAGASDTQLAADQAALLAAEASLVQAQQAATDATLRASIAGTVVSLDLAVGDLVGDSAAAAAADGETSPSAVRVVSTGRLVVDATVASADVARLKEGLQAEITPVGVTEPVYGTVASVGLVAETSSTGAAVFPVTIEVTGRRADLYAGTSADAAVVVKQVEDVLAVPSRALQTDDDGTTYVDEIVDGETVKTVVEIGTTYGMATEIVSGLEEGDEIEIPTFTPGGSSGGPSEQRFPEGGPGPQGQFVGGGQ